LSDGYRSIMALAGDLVWRLIQAFPNSNQPLHEQGVALIDELDIHLHPLWQRDIALWLQEQFPHLQFIVATHSPLVASGAGEAALTLQFKLEGDKAAAVPVDKLAAMNVDRILESPAFGLVSSYSPQTTAKINRYDQLIKKQQQRTASENQELKQLQLFMNEIQPFGGPPVPGSLEAKVERFLEKALSD
jgi:predicted ATP-binding protein involved in virulence